MKRRPSVWEWMGVTIIVLFVAAVLFPIFAKSREGSVHGSCLSQTKQLGLGLLQYTDNYDGLMPPTTHDANETWRVAVYSQIKSVGVYKCPDDDRPTGPDGYYSSYAMNDGGRFSTPHAPPCLDWYAVPCAPNPETLVLLCEVQNTIDPDFNIDTVPPAAHVLAVRHSDGGNYLLSDGHSKWFRPSAFTDAYSRVRWYRDPKRPLSANAQAVLKAAP